MKTRHQIYFKNSKNMAAIPSGSIDLVVTSPPYPMIEMWDDGFKRQNRDIREALTSRNGLLAFELMHKALDEVWNEVYRILKQGAIACVNIGDAARSIGDNFGLYPNHSRILTQLLKIGFSALPLILWRKQTNAPNKFMGSGMLPAGAYVTLEHEYILILRKGPKREFMRDAEKQTRRESAIFWEERNNWYSDVWLDLKGTVQKLDNDGSRSRSGAFPFELPYRLINMFSVKGDTVVDPFLGTGTTLWAAMVAGRNSMGFELDAAFRDEMVSKMDILVNFANEKISDRLQRHLMFIRQRLESGGGFKYKNKHYKFPVITNQEKELFLNPMEAVAESGKNIFEATYALESRQQFDEGWEIAGKPQPNGSNRQKQLSLKSPKRAVQLELP